MGGGKERCRGREGEREGGEGKGGRRGRGERGEKPVVTTPTHHAVGDLLVVGQLRWGEASGDCVTFEGTLSG